MIGGLQTAARRRGKDDGEKPFWISFSDLMSALMVLFLVAMSVARRRYRIGRIRKEGRGLSAPG